MKEPTGTDMKELSQLIANLNLNIHNSPCKSPDPDTNLAVLSLTIKIENDAGGKLCNSDGLHPSNENSGDIIEESNNVQDFNEELICHKRGPQRCNKHSHGSTPYPDPGRSLFGHHGSTDTSYRRISACCQLASDGHFFFHQNTDIHDRHETCISRTQDLSPPISPQLKKCLLIENGDTILDLEDEFLVEDELLLEALESLPFSDEPFPDLGISDLFPDFHSPSNSTINASDLEFKNNTNKNDCSFSCADQQVPNVVPPIVEEQLSPRSTDFCLVSNTADCVSNASSPVSSPTNEPSMHTFQITSARKRTSSNPYMADLDKEYRDRCCKNILAQAYRKDGLNWKDKYNRTLLHLSIQQKNQVYAIVLLNMLQKSFQNGTGKMSLPTFTDLPSFLNQRDDFGRTPLLLACKYSLPKVLEYLLDCRASPSLDKEFYSGSVLHYVCKYGNQFKEVAEILCTKAASCINMPNTRKETPLHVAVRYHGTECENGDSNTIGKVDNSSLIKILLEKNARLKVQDVLGRTPLHWMIKTKNFDLMNLLLSRARDWKEAVNLQDKEGKTVLHGVAEYSDVAMQVQKNLVHKLLACSASPLVSDNLGRYPKDLTPDDRKEHLSVLNDPFCDSEHLNMGIGSF